MFADQDSFTLLRKAGKAVADTKFIDLKYNLEEGCMALLFV